MKRYLVFAVLFAAIAIFVKLADVFGKLDNFLAGIAVGYAILALISYFRKRRPANNR